MVIQAIVFPLMYINVKIWKSNGDKRMKLIFYILIFWGKEVDDAENGNIIKIMLFKSAQPEMLISTGPFSHF